MDEHESPSPQSAMRLLVVDDSRAMRRIMQRLLREAGFDQATLLEASDGAEALELARRHAPQVVIADYNMPRMNGLELHRALRAQGARTFFLLVSSEAARLHAQASLAGVDFVLPKPVCPDSLREALAPLGSGGRLAVPCADRVARLFTDLLGRPTKVRPCYRAVLAGTRPVMVGTYRNEPGAMALLALDMELAAYTAAALAEAPLARARESLEAASFPAEMLETLGEFLCVAASMLSSPGLAPLSLQGKHTQLRQLPPRAVALAVSPRAQAVFEVEIPGYGVGGMSVAID